MTVVLWYFGGFLCTLGTWVGYIPFSGYIFLPTCHPGDYLSTVHLLINICGVLTIIKNMYYTPLCISQTTPKDVYDVKPGYFSVSVFLSTKGCSGNITPQNER